MSIRLQMHELVILIAILGIGASKGVIGQESAIPASTPSSIMLVEVHQEEGFSSDPYFWTRLGDSDGWTLFYTNQTEVSDEFKPVVADKNAVAFDDWSLISHKSFDQWAYQGHPLFTWVKEKEPGQVALNVALYDNIYDKLNDPNVLLPPEGWQVSRFLPENSISIPDGFDVRLVDSGQGVALTTHQGFSIYGYANGQEKPENICINKECYEYWAPVNTPALAKGFGEFSVVNRIDGTRQWAYRGEPLFLFKGDLLPGDAHGRGEHLYMQLARISETFNPVGVDVASLKGYGDILTLDGKTLYFGSAFEKYWGGRNLRGSFDIAYHKGKRLGGDACVSETCLETWRPFLAPIEAKSSGFWEIITRTNGLKQWAYKGFALYTFSDDEALGDIRGHSLYDIAYVDGDNDAINRTKMLAELGNATGGAGIYWSVVKP